MSSVSHVAESPYVLATGEQTVRRLHVLHDIYSPVGHRVLLRAGLTKGMNVADFGCGVGVVTRMLAEMVGPSGTVTGIDVNGAQIEQAAELCSNSGLTNTRFVQADACGTGLPRNSFDLVYCRFLLLHLPHPEDCLEEMRALLRPGGILVVEDGDIASAGSNPPSLIDMYADMFCRLGEIRGLNYSLAKDLFHLVVGAGFCDVDMEIHQPAMVRGQNRLFLKWSIEEAGPAFLEAGLVTPGELAQALSEMQRIADDPRFVILAPRMSLVWGRKQS